MHVYSFKFLGSIQRYWGTIWIGMGGNIRPCGHRILQNLICSLDQYDVALSNGDCYTLRTLYLTSAQWELALLPFTKNAEVSNVLRNAANACKCISRIIANGGSLADVADFEKKQLTNLNAAINTPNNCA